MVLCEAPFRKVDFRNPAESKEVWTSVKKSLTALKNKRYWAQKLKSKYRHMRDASFIQGQPYRVLEFRPDGSAEVVAESTEQAECIDDFERLLSMDKEAGPPGGVLKRSTGGARPSISEAVPRPSFKREFTMKTKAGSCITISAPISPAKHVSGATYHLESNSFQTFKDVPDEDEDVATDAEQEAMDEVFEKLNQLRSTGTIPPLNIIILIVGSRGDVQPFLALALRLKSYGHKVRLSSHVKFTQFVRENGVDFYPLRGDPETLMEYMSEHPDMISLDPAQLKQQKNTLIEIFDSAYLACTTPSRRSGGTTYRPDVIISNPPVAVHTHIAEALQVPLQIMFTMPWSPTEAYRHPFSSFGPTRVFGNKESYGAIDKMIWTGQAALINKFRKHVLGLKKIKDGATLVEDLKIPQTYCMSPNLAAKPTDWGPHVDVVGFWFLDLNSSFNPRAKVPDLVDWLEKGEKPFYIGFGSIVVSNPSELSKKVIAALEKARKPDGSPIRAIVHKGWAKLGEGMDLGDNFFVLEAAVPHDWLFPLCSACCHHGGAGTLAAGLRVGLPTIVVPFFGDQPFWGGVTAAKGVGPKPIFNTELDSSGLCKAIEFCYRPEVIEAAKLLGEKISSEDGVEAGFQAFHRKLPVKDGSFMCEVYENQKRDGSEWKPQSNGWSDFTMIHRRIKDKFELPHGWRWDGPWTVEIGSDTDQDGWRYSKHNRPFKRWNINTRSGNLFRRRRWIRTRTPDPRAPPNNRMASFWFNKDTPVTIYVTVERGEGLKDMDFPKMYPNDVSDPYVKIRVKHNNKLSQRQITKIIMDNLNPVWNQTFYFQVYEGDELELRCFDYDYGSSDDFIGGLFIPIDPNNFGKSVKYTLSHDGGFIYLTMNWFEEVTGKDLYTGKVFGRGIEGVTEMLPTDPFSYAKFSVEVLNPVGKPAMVEGGHDIKVAIKSKATGAAVDHKLTELDDGKMQVSYNIFDPGDYLIDVLLYGLPIQGSPFTKVFKRMAGTSEAASTIQTNWLGKSVVYGRGVGGKTMMMPDDPFAHAKFTLEIRDTSGRQVKFGGHEVAVNIKSVATGAAMQGIKIQDHKDGLYSISYDVHEPGEYSIEVLTKGLPIEGSPFNKIFERVQM